MKLLVECFMHGQPDSEAECLLCAPPLFCSSGLAIPFFIRAQSRDANDTQNDTRIDSDLTLIVRPPLIHIMAETQGTCSTMRKDQLLNCVAWISTNLK